MKTLSALFVGIVIGAGLMAMIDSRWPTGAPSVWCPDCPTKPPPQPAPTPAPCPVPRLPVQPGAPLPEMP